MRWYFARYRCVACNHNVCHSYSGSSAGEACKNPAYFPRYSHADTLGSSRPKKVEEEPGSEYGRNVYAVEDIVGRDADEIVVQLCIPSMRQVVFLLNVVCERSD